MQSGKVRGNEAFRSGDFINAIKIYTEALDDLDIDITTRFHCYLNRALARLKLEQYDEALADVDTALALQPSSTKALYRRALALDGVGDRDQALKVLVDLCNTDPGQSNLYRALMHSIRECERNASLLATSVLKNSNQKFIESDLRKIAHLLSDNKQAAEISHHEQFLRYLFKNCSMNDQPQSTIAQLSFAVLVQIIRAEKSTAGFLDSSKIADRVKHSRFASQWLLLLSIVVNSIPHSTATKSLIDTLRDGLQTEFAHDPLDTERCNRILSTACGIAISSPSLLGDIRSALLLPVLSAPTSVRSTLDLFKIIAVFSECKTGQADEIDSGPKLNVPSAEFLNATQNLISDWMKSSETLPTALSALSLILAAVPAAALHLVGESERLSTLLEMASSNEELRSAATTVLALASYDTSVREAILEADYSSVFVDALGSRDPLVVAHACMALSKLMASNENIRSEILSTPIVLHQICQLLNCSGVCADRIRQISFEALMYLSAFVEIKTALTSEPDLLMKFIEASKAPDPSLKYAVAQIVATLSTSTDDYKFDTELDSEKSKLKEVASKGIPGRKPGLDLPKVAGSVGEIARVRVIILEAGIGRILSDLVISHSSSQRSGMLDGTVVKAFKHLSSVPSHCGRLVSDGALTALLRIVQNSDCPRPAGILYDARLSVARLCIRTNPALIGSRAQGALPNVCLTLIEEAKHELHEYEGLLALTNAASVNEEIRNQIMGMKGWQRLLMCLSSSNELVQTAALEALVNLIPSQSAIDRLLKQKSAAEQDIKIFLMFFRSSANERTTAAALAGLAMMSEEPQLAKAIEELGGNEMLLRLSKLKGNNNIQIRSSALLKNLQNIKR